MILPPNVSNRPDTLFPYPPLLRAPPEAHRIDITANVGAALARIAPDIVIHTTGPFQAQDHDVAKACIAQGCHYLDLIKSISRRSDSCFSGVGDRIDAGYAEDILISAIASQQDRIQSCLALESDVGRRCHNALIGC